MNFEKCSANRNSSDNHESRRTCVRPATGELRSDGSCYSTARRCRCTYMRGWQRCAECTCFSLSFQATQPFLGGEDEYQETRWPTASSPRRLLRGSRKPRWSSSPTSLSYSYGLVGSVSWGKAEKRNNRLENDYCSCIQDRQRCDAADHVRSVLIPYFKTIYQTIHWAAHYNVYSSNDMLSREFKPWSDLTFDETESQRMEATGNGGIRVRRSPTDARALRTSRQELYKRRVQLQRKAQ